MHVCHHNMENDKSYGIQIQTCIYTNTTYHLYNARCGRTTCLRNKRRTTQQSKPRIHNAKEKYSSRVLNPYHPECTYKRMFLTKHGSTTWKHLNIQSNTRHIKIKVTTCWLTTLKNNNSLLGAQFLKYP